MNLSSINLSLGRGGTSLTQQVAALFSAGEQGAWYDPSDFSTMFQDAAGTTPVTAVGQAVGLILDKSKGLVLGQELVTNGDFSNGTTGWTVTAGTTSVVDGKLRLTRNVAGGRFGQGKTTEIGKTYKVSIDYSVGTAGPCIFRITNNADQTADARNFFVQLVSGVNTFYVQATATTTYFVIGSTSGDSDTYSEFDNISAKEIAGNHATQTTDTKRPVLQQDANGKYYLLFDGIDDALQTASINFTGTDKVTVWAGVRKLSDAASGIVAELGDAIPGFYAFLMAAPSANGANSYRFSSSGSTSFGVAGTGIFAVAPDTAVLTGIGNISGDISQLRRNGVIVATSTIDQGFGNYNNYPLYIGSRGGTTLPFNGRLYSLIIRGAQSTATQISTAETYVNSKAQAY